MYVDLSMPFKCVYVCIFILLGVNGFTLDPSIGEFILTHPNVKIPPRGKTYSFNEARAPWWPKGLQDYVMDAKLGQVASGQTHTSRSAAISYLAILLYICIAGDSLTVLCKNL